MKIKKGTSKMKWVRGIGAGRWHRFSQDCTATFKIDSRTYAELLVVKNGPDRGTYIAAGWSE